MIARMPFPNEYRTITLCLDDYDECCLQGRLYHPAWQQPVVFANAMQLLLAVQSLLDELDFPQSQTELRAFAPAKPAIPTCPVDIPQEGRKATFSLKIIFRQHASWQGSLSWLEKGQEQTFRSVLELLMLLHSALHD